MGGPLIEVISDHGGDVIFRVGGDWVRRITGKPHIKTNRIVSGVLTARRRGAAAAHRARAREEREHSGYNLLD